MKRRFLLWNIASVPYFIQCCNYYKKIIYMANSSRFSKYSKRYCDILPTEISPTDISPTDISPNGYFAGRHFADWHFVEGFSAENPDILPTDNSQTDIFSVENRDYTTVSHMTGLRRIMYFAVHIIICINIQSSIKTHVFMFAVFFNFLSLVVVLVGNGSITDLGACCIDLRLMFFAYLICELSA